MAMDQDTKDQPSGAKPQPPHQSWESVKRTRKKVENWRTALKSLGPASTTATTPSTFPPGSTRTAPEIPAITLVPDPDESLPRIEAPRGYEESVSVLFQKIVPGGWKNVFRLFACLDLGPEDPRMIMILAWNDMSGQRRKAIGLHDFCDAVGVTPGKMFGLACQTAVEVDSVSASFVRSINQTEVIQHMVKFAKKKDGFKDREALLKSSGFLPTPAGTSINVKAAAMASARSMAKAGRLDDGLESMEDDTLEFTEVIRSGHVRSGEGADV